MEKDEFPRPITTLEKRGFSKSNININQYKYKGKY